MSKQQFKAIPSGQRNEWLVIEFYLRPGLGECHTGYSNVIALCAADAVAITREAA